MTIHVRHDNATNWISIDRIDKKNALTGDMYAAMADAIEKAEADEGIALHAFTGASGVFTAGNDIKDFMSMASSGLTLENSPIIRFLMAIARAEKPMLAAVDGPAVGVGTTLLMHCDVVLATPEATFKTPFVDLGLVPEAGSSLLGPAIMGHQRAFALLALGETFTAQRAYESGLISHIVGQDDLTKEASRIAGLMAAKPRNALLFAKKLMRGSRDELIARINEEAELFAKALTSQEAQQAFMAFMMRSATGKD